MGSSCSQPEAVAIRPAQEILVLVDKINIVSGHSKSEIQLLKRILSRNSAILKRRIEEYEEKLTDAGEENPTTEIWRAEKKRAEGMLKLIMHMRMPLAFIS